MGDFIDILWQGLINDFSIILFYPVHKMIYTCHLLFGLSAGICDRRLVNLTAHIGLTNLT